jgi:5-methylcytosine-specific restriction endonuclease McrA
MEKCQRRPNTKCKICEKAIYRRPCNIAKANGNAFCSSTCHGKYQSKERPCPVCGKQVLAKKHAVCCSRECSNKNRTGIKYGIGRPRCNVVKLRTLKSRLIEERGPNCQICGYDNTNIIVAHHIIERSNGGSDDPSNLQLLCPNCHMTIHHGDSRLNG